MVALTIAAVLMVTALPAFNGFIVQRQMAANVNSMVAAITYARSEATRRGTTMSVQRTGGSSTNEWGAGFCVTEGNPGNCDNALRIFEITGDATFDALGDLDDETALSFNSRGLILNGVSGTIELCSADADENPGRVLNLNAIGRASVLEQVCEP